MIELLAAYVVDDDGAVREAICLSLRYSDFIVAVAYASAVAFLRRVWPNGNSCLITDLHMPGITGLQLIEQLRREGNMVPAILMSGQFTDQDRATAGRLGALVLQKPFRPKQLLDAIEGAPRLAGSKSSRRSLTMH